MVEWPILLSQFSIFSQFVQQLVQFVHFMGRSLSKQLVVLGEPSFVLRYHFHQLVHALVVLIKERTELTEENESSTDACDCSARQVEELLTKRAELHVQIFRNTEMLDAACFACVENDLIKV